MSGWRRMSRLRVGVLVATILLASVASFSWWRISQGQERVAAPPWRPGVVGCREQPLAHVSNPHRLLVVAPCATVSGVVQQVELDNRSGNLEIVVRPDSQYAAFLPPENEGLLQVQVIPPDQPTLVRPEAGRPATFYGAWVLNKGRARRAELHPAWFIATPGTNVAIRTQRILDVRTELPESVQLGGEVNVTVAVQSIIDGVARPASQVRAFLEIFSDEGEAVRWKVISTNTRGLATANLASLDLPGDYSLRVFAWKDRQVGEDEVPFRITYRGSGSRVKPAGRAPRPAAPPSEPAEAPTAGTGAAPAPPREESTPTAAPAATDAPTATPISSRSRPAATAPQRASGPTVVRGSRGLGLTAAEWERLYGRAGETVGEYIAYQRGEYTVAFLDGRVRSVERQFGGRGRPTLEEARQDIRGTLAPTDSRLGRTFYPLGNRVVDEHVSDSLRRQFPGGAGRRLWTDSRPGSFTVLYRLDEEGRMLSLLIQVGDLR